MASFDVITALIPTLMGRISAGASVEDVQAVMLSASDAEVVSVLEEVAELGRVLERIGLVGAGVIGVRSRREAGHSGLAQRLGYRSPVALVQQLTGVTKGEAARQVRVGEALVAPEVPAAGGPGERSPEPDGSSEPDAGAGVDAGSEVDPGAGFGPVPEPECESDDAQPEPSRWCGMSRWGGRCGRGG